MRQIISAYPIKGPFSGPRKEAIMKKQNWWLYTAMINMAVLAFAVNAPAYIISDNMWNKADKHLSIETVQQNPALFEGATVLWGGEILETTNTDKGTMLTVLETPMNYELRPMAENASRGIFSVLIGEKLDPDKYKKGKAVTVGGAIAGSHTKTIDMAKYITGGTYANSEAYYPTGGTYIIGEPSGPKAYAVPIVQAEEYHLWATHPFYTFPYYGKTSE